MTRLLEIRDLRASYNASEVLHGIDMNVEAGQVTALLGANGAGKTTTLRAICRFMARTSGKVTFRGQQIEDRSTEQIAVLGVGHVPDGRGTFLGLTTRENLYLGCHARKDRRAVEEDVERMYDYFPRLKERRAQQAGTLSGGEQQMLAIARALMARPALLLLDEPSFGLAPMMVRDIFAIMRRIRDEQQVAILLVEQNARIALELADTAYLLESGRIVKHGTSESMRGDDAVRRAYLGE
ncbi:ABC transporter ATP-binding protein [Burkholderia cepacia]|uniref:ABC transporter-like protein n=1 Tax=Burkholderia cepacia GG4 TaxID=1009846 RepID=A0A9W3K5D1_BURCE|nr:MULTISPECIES: ABC transporter ATP-binding protein [Burkholderia cepacia complex]AFQ51053.1 ABC transporter-like protein [Burkholderia cepacia GG4]MBE2966682.1 ABC transporter ATP-binding protein [Burkholderia cepacia]RQU90559.1 ABC transporter ATP-binding protein [Burkholderia cenocepacia]RQV30305.1 ABC transporter ATP-binding protein [Burkholderia cenocepacia]RQV88866.1 ABC transporter ATP-binding protein [Burkholderia cenocepacia]